MIRLRRSGAPPTVGGDDEVRVAWQCASVLLGYPDAALISRLEVVRRAAGLLPGAVGEPLRECADALDTTRLPELAAEYVATFDTQRRHNLYLTYFAHGDTRKRGVALLRFAQTYRGSGAELTPDELPDHLCVVLEYAATVDLDAGRRLILDHRAGLELLRLSLAESRSRWAGAVEAVSATLPPLAGDEHAAVARLAAEGPPAEEVGLTPYGTPAFDAAHSEHRVGAGVDLPMPSLRRA